MASIRKINFEKDKYELLEVIHESFITVAREFNLTARNAPTNPAFLSLEKLEESVNSRLDFFLYFDGGKVVGCVGIQPGKKDKEYYIERLGVLPELRHKGIGKKLLDYAVHEIKKRKGKTISIGIIDENTMLKGWYTRYGFENLGTHKFEHLPFTVCFMGMNI